MNMRVNNKRYIDDDYSISVNFFDAIKGLSKETTDIVNAKIDEVKTRSEMSIAKLIKANEELQVKIAKYASLKPTNYLLAEMSYEQVVSGLAALTDDISMLYDLFEKYYGEKCFMPAMSMKHGFADPGEIQTTKAQMQKLERQSAK